MNKSLYQETNYDKGALKEFAKDIANEYGLDSEKFLNTIQYESGFNPDPPGNLLSRGIAQFTLDTWLGNCDTEDNRLNPYASIRCMAFMWNKGMEYRWDAFCDLYYDTNCINLRGLYPGFLNKNN